MKLLQRISIISASAAFAFLSAVTLAAADDTVSVNGCRIHAEQDVSRALDIRVREPDHFPNKFLPSQFPKWIENQHARRRLR